MNPFKKETKQNWSKLKAFKPKQRIQWGERTGTIIKLKVNHIEIKWDESIGNTTIYNDASMLNLLTKPKRKKKVSNVHYLKPVNGIVYLDDNYNQINVDVQHYFSDSGVIREPIQYNHDPSPALQEGVNPTLTQLTTEGVLEEPKEKKLNDLSPRDIEGLVDDIAGNIKII
jgi:hypothetical protein